jgi:hypothetical protein
MPLAVLADMAPSREQFGSPTFTDQNPADCPHGAKKFSACVKHFTVARSAPS